MPLFKIRMTFYGRGFKPRTINGFSCREGAENEALELLNRYENMVDTEQTDGKRVKRVEVLDEHNNVLTSWSYGEAYRREVYVHGYPAFF